LQDGSFEVLAVITLSLVFNEGSLLVDGSALFLASFFFLAGGAIWGGRILLVPVLRGASTQG
jgi:hypothetical protein